MLVELAESLHQFLKGRGGWRKFPERKSQTLADLCANGARVLLTDRNYRQSFAITVLAGSFGQRTSEIVELTTEIREARRHTDKDRF